MACNGIDIQSPVYIVRVCGCCGQMRISICGTNVLFDFRIVSVWISLYDPLLPPPLHPVFLLEHSRKASTRRERRYVVPEQTRQSMGGQAESRGGTGVIVLQNNLNFNYFGELQKRRCDSLTVCHRKINWLLLLPSTTFRAYEPFSLSLLYIYIHTLHFLI